MRRRSTQYVCSNRPARLAATVLLWGSFPALQAAPNSAQPPAPALTVRLFDNVGLPGSELRAAASEAQRILRAAGVESDWLLCSRSPTQAGQDAGCHGPRQPGDLNVGILPPSMEKNFSLADSFFGAAVFTPDGRPTSYVYVFHGRVEKMVEETPCSSPALLGYVIVHEVSHLLLGRTHTPGGVMSARWDKLALRQISRGLLLFSADEARRLRAGALARGRQQ